MLFTSSLLSLAGVASALSYNSYSATKNGTTTNTVSAYRIPTNAPPKVCNVTTVTVYETANGPTATASGAKATSSAKVAQSFGYKENDFNYDKANSMKLQACNHWTHDTKDPKNLIPISAGKKTQLYYAENGDAQPSKSFYFGIIDLLFKAPAVVLDKSAYVTKTSYSGNQLVIEFSSSYSCEFAKTSWTKGTILVSSTAGCNAAADDDHCYFKVDDIEKSSDGKSLVCKGTAQSQDQCTEGGEAQWGMYKPRNNGGYKSNETATATSGVWPTGTGSFPTPISTGTPVNSTDIGNNTFGDHTNNCKAPVDNKYNLPTVCLGDYFDEDLDDVIGHGDLSPDDVAFLKEATAGLDSDTLTSTKRALALNRRHVKPVQKRFIRKFIRAVKNKIIAPAIKALKTAVNVTVAVAKGAVQLITTGTISGSIRESFSFALPNGQQASAKQVTSPWGPAVLVAAYGKEPKVKADQGLEVAGYLNIFCVGCGAQGKVELAGRATWAVGKGITQGELEAWADIKAALKIGVDAQIQLKREWKNNLFQMGLPGLSFGVITIGPQVRLDSRVTLEAAAEGRILAGAELNWNRAYAKVDLVDSSKSTRKNFDPVPHPIFEASGSIFVGAELGLPIGLHFGISVSSWKKTVALINEPMIRGIAKAAAKAELVNGALTAGFTPTEGCVGIHANLSWRNRLYGNVLDVKEFDIFDTGYKSIKSTCIPIGKQTPPAPTLRRRQTDLTVLPDGITEITASVQGATDMVSYAIGGVPTLPYARTDGYEFTKLMAETGDYNIMFCSNGDMYVKKASQNVPLGCDELFAYSDSNVVGDGAGRYFFFQKNSMEAAGVSRLRLGDEENSVLGTSAVALVPWNAAEAETDPDAEIEGLYFAADYDTEEFFWLAFCEYKDGQASKVFAVRDLDTGLAVLESADVKFSVTGGEVNKCYALMAKQQVASEAEWTTTDNGTPGGLQFNL